MTDEPKLPKIERVTLPVCELCMDGEGDECHVPGCVFWCKGVVQNLRNYAIPTEPPPAFIVTDVEIAAAIHGVAVKDAFELAKCWDVKRVAEMLNRADGRVIDVVALSLKCLAAVHINEYMEDQLDGIQVAILNAIEGKENGE